ncbi:MAG: hypothetical protein U1F06_05310 [Steroidobacteraceae bacterium]
MLEQRRGNLAAGRRAGIEHALAARGSSSGAGELRVRVLHRDAACCEAGQPRHRHRPLEQHGRRHRRQRAGRQVGRGQLGQVVGDAAARCGRRAAWQRMGVVGCIDGRQVLRPGGRDLLCNHCGCAAAAAGSASTVASSASRSRR